MPTMSISSIESCGSILRRDERDNMGRLDKFREVHQHRSRVKAPKYVPEECIFGGDTLKQETATDIKHIKFPSPLDFCIGFS